jgi:hypothetical protein
MHTRVGLMAASAMVTDWSPLWDRSGVRLGRFFACVIGRAPLAYR